MAKEEIHSWSRTVITILSLAFVCGITYRGIGENSEDIGTVEVKVDKHTEDIHKLQLNERDMQGVYTRIDGSLKRLETEQKGDGEYIQKMLEAIIKMQAQMNNLERVD